MRKKITSGCTGESDSEGKLDVKGSFQNDAKPLFLDETTQDESELARDELVLVGPVPVTRREPLG
ncbi:MAG TPA: hypothetical protein VHC97_18295 [Thermoanaerobaculia bacterium]|nr:hypothetical protein [Thermoanaerobaculia bacterium]